MSRRGRVTANLHAGFAVLLVIACGPSVPAAPTRMLGDRPTPAFETSASQAEGTARSEGAPASSPSPAVSPVVDLAPVVAPSLAGPRRTQIIPPPVNPQVTAAPPFGIRSTPVVPPAANVHATGTPPFATASLPTVPPAVNPLASITLPSGIRATSAIPTGIRATAAIPTGIRATAAIPSAVLPSGGRSSRTAEVQIANTDGQGAYLRRRPSMADRLSAHAEGTRLRVVGDRHWEEGQWWLPVRTLDGTIAWIPEMYTRPAERITGTPIIPIPGGGTTSGQRTPIVPPPEQPCPGGVCP